MKFRLITLMIVAGLFVGFACGWLVAQAQNIHKVSPSTVYANSWMSEIALLTRNNRNTDLIAPDKVVLLVGSNLNTDSLVLGKLYDDMSPAMKERLLSYIPAARAIAAVQSGPRSENNRQDLLAFINCMQKIKSQGGLVQKCMHDGPK